MAIGSQWADENKIKSQKPRVLLKSNSSKISFQMGEMSWALAMVLVGSALIAVASCQLLEDGDNYYQMLEGTQGVGDGAGPLLLQSAANQQTADDELLSQLLASRMFVPTEANRVPNVDHGSSIRQLENGGSDPMGGFLMNDEQAREQLGDNLDSERLAQLLAYLSAKDTSLKSLPLEAERRDQRASSGDYQGGALGAQLNDINSHLPATFADRPLSGPINEPEDFEAVLGQFTDTLNHRLPNSHNRSAALEDLLTEFYANFAGSSTGGDGSWQLEELRRMLNQHRKQQQQQRAADDEIKDAGSMGERQQRDPNEEDSNRSYDRQWGEDNNRDSNNIDSNGHINDDNANSAHMATGGGDGDDDINNNDIATAAAEAEGAAPAARYGNSEYIDHPLALAGHQYVQGGAGEGRQLLGPEGTFENVQVVKSDRAVPSYCDPPNPCPLGYTEKDGCLETFVNSASFSRGYQARQQCSCDNEHSLFNCASPLAATTEPKSSSQTNNQSRNSAATAAAEENEVDNGAEETTETTTAAQADGGEGGPDQQMEPLKGKLSTLARTIQNRFGDLASIQNLIAKQELKQKEQRQQQQQVVVGDQLIRTTRKNWHSLNVLD